LLLGGYTVQAGNNKSQGLALLPGMKEITIIFVQ